MDRSINEPNVIPPVDARLMESKTKISRADAGDGGSEELPYRVELWHRDKRDSVERVLARALNAQLARAIFKAAQDEYPERRITIRKGSRVFADSTG